MVEMIDVMARKMMMILGIRQSRTGCTCGLTSMPLRIMIIFLHTKVVYINALDTTMRGSKRHRIQSEPRIAEGIVIMILTNIVPS